MDENKAPEAEAQKVTAEMLGEMITKAVDVAMEAKKAEIDSKDRKELEEKRLGFNILREPLGEEKFSLGNVFQAQLQGNSPESWRMYAKHELAAIERNHREKFARLSGLSFSEQKAAVTEGSASGYPLSGGGSLVPIEFVADMIEFVRAKTVVRELGASTLHASSLTGFIPRQSAAATANWIGENSAITESEPTFDQVQYVLKKLAAFSIASSEMVMDSNPKVQSIIERDLALQIAVAEDLAYLQGSGAGNQPTGIKSTSGITTQSLGTNGRVPNFDDLVAARYNLELNNFELSGFAWHPRTSQEFRQSKDSVNRYLWDEGLPAAGSPPTVLGVPYKTTTQIPINLTVGTSTTASNIYAAQWDQAIVVEGGDLEVMASNVAGSAFQNDAVYIRAKVRRDFQVRHPLAFVLVTGVN